MHRNPREEVELKLLSPIGNNHFPGHRLQSDRDQFESCQTRISDLSLPKMPQAQPELKKVGTLPPATALVALSR